MIPVVERKGEINMGTITGGNLVDVKKCDTIYKYVDKDSAWYFRQRKEPENGSAYPKGIMCLACKNMKNPGHYFGLMILEDLQLVDHDSSPDFDTLDEAIGWLQERIPVLLAALDMPLELPVWKDIPANFQLFCVSCKHRVGYRENRDNGRGQGQYFSCKEGFCPNDKYECSKRELI